MTSDTAHCPDPIRLGVAGLGRAFVLTQPSIEADSRIVLSACAAPRRDSRDHFMDLFGGRGYDTVDGLCSDPEVEAIYIATPHQMHRDHAVTALRAGKHVLIDKPLCIGMEDAQAIVDCAEETGRHVIVGPSHSFDLQIQKTLDLIESGEFGPVRMIHALNYTDFLYRPRRPEELVTAEGGGVVFSQAVHQVDIVRLLGGGLVDSLYAATGSWDPARPTECAYSAHLTFRSGAFASLTYSGHAHFDSNEFCDWVGELGSDADPDSYGKARAALTGVGSASEEAALKSTRTFGGSGALPEAAHNEHFGPVIVSCDHADLRPTPDGVWIYADGDRRFVPVPTQGAPRRAVFDALWAAVREDRPAVQDARWGLASLEVCHAILRSAEMRTPVMLNHQVPVRGRG